MIEPNEELDCYVGMSLNEVENDLTDKDVVYRVIKPGMMYTMNHLLHRVNIKVDDNDIVTSVYYG